MWKRINNVPKMDTSSTHKDMRYFIYYPPKDSMRLIDVNENVLVDDILTLVKKEFGLDIDDNHETESSIVLSYNGSDLKPKWSFSDLSIPSGSIIRCLYREKKAADLYIHCSFNKQIFKLFDSSITNETTIRTIRKTISNRLGLPLSTFCLETYDGKQRLYDEMKLVHYDLQLHDHIYLKVWRGYEKFIDACVKGFTGPFSHDDLSRHYQTQIALYIAAFYGHMELANSVMQQGARSDRPVGEHPSRQWSSELTKETLPEMDKCPIHIAVERGHVKIVDLFVRQSILCTQIRDPITDLLPYKTALSYSLQAINKHDKQRYRVIYYYLHDKQFNLKIPLNSNGKYVSHLLTSKKSAHAVHHSSANLVYVSLPFYCKIISWYERAREKAWKQYGGGFYITTQRNRVYPKQGLLGYKVLVDGFNNTFEVPEEQLRNKRSGGDFKSDENIRYAGLSEEEREKIIKMKAFIKDFALDERKRAKQTAAANLQQTRRPPLVVLPPKKTSNQNKQSSLVSESISSSSDMSSMQRSSNSIVPDLKTFKSIPERQSSSILNLTSSSIIEKMEGPPKTLYKKLPPIPSVVINEQEQQTLPIIMTSKSNSPTTQLSVTNKSETVITNNKKDIQTKMSSVDAYKLSSSLINLDTERRKAAERRKLFTQIKQSVENPPQPLQEKSTNLLSVPLPVDRKSIDVDTYIALPDHSTVRRLSPIKSHIDVDVRQSVVQPYERYASATTRSTAVHCLQEAGYFKGKSWLKQVEISKEMVKHRAKRRIQRADKETNRRSPLLPLRTKTVTTSVNDTIKV